MDKQTRGFFPFTPTCYYFGTCCCHSNQLVHCIDNREVLQTVVSSVMLLCCPNLFPFQNCAV
jgi:hypothetical protein